MNRRDRQVQLQRLPMCPVVERYIDAELGARVQQAFPLWVLAHRAHVGTLRYTGNNPRPGLASIMGLVNERLQIIELVPVDGGECSSRIMRGRLNDTDHA